MKQEHPDYPLMSALLKAGQTIVHEYTYGDGYEPGDDQWNVNDKEIREHNNLRSEMLGAWLNDHLITEVIEKYSWYFRERVTGFADSGDDPEFEEG